METPCAKESITNAKESINNSYAPLPHDGVAVLADMPGLVLWVSARKHCKISIWMNRNKNHDEKSFQYIFIFIRNSPHRQILVCV